MTTKVYVGTIHFQGREKQQSFSVERSQFSCQMKTLSMLGSLKKDSIWLGLILVINVCNLSWTMVCWAR